MISVTIPVFNEAQNLPPLYDELKSVLQELGRPYEIIFVNDGSKDKSAFILKGLAKADKQVKVIHFRRNYGQTAAMMAGFDKAKGDIIVPMDADLQNDPRDIPKLIKKLEEGFDLCSGWRRVRRDSLVKRVVSRSANWIISKVCGLKLHDYGCTMKAYRRSAIDGIRLYGEMHRFLPIHAMWQGAKVSELTVNHRPRKFGKSNYGLERTMKVVLDLMVVGFIDRYLSKPIYLFGGLGITSFVLSVLSFGGSIYYKFWGGKTFVETPLPLLGAMTFISSVLLLLMGILAELLMRTYYESQNKPTYLIEDED